MHLVSPMYCFLFIYFFLHLVKDVEIHDVLCSFLVSPALIKAYDVLPSMYGQVRHLCLELQRNVPPGVSDEFPVFASFGRKG